MTKRTPQESAPHPTQQNIEAIAKLEEEALDRRTAAAHKRCDRKCYWQHALSFAACTVSGDLEHCKSEPCPRRQSIRPFSVRHFGPLACGRKRFPHDLRPNEPEQNGSRSGKALSSRSASRYARRAGAHRNTPSATKALPSCGR